MRRSVNPNREILGQVQEVVIPVICWAMENKLIREYSDDGRGFWSCCLVDPRSSDLFDSMYELIDNLTFKLASISPNMWPMFEMTYALFKSDAVDFLEGECYVVH